MYLKKMQKANTKRNRRDLNQKCNICNERVWAKESSCRHFPGSTYIVDGKLVKMIPS